MIDAYVVLIVVIVWYHNDTHLSIHMFWFFTTVSLYCLCLSFCCKSLELPEKLCLACSMDQRRKWVPHRRCNLLGWAWLMLVPYMQLPMQLQMPAFQRNQYLVLPQFLNIYKITSKFQFIIPNYKQLIIFFSFWRVRIKLYGQSRLVILCVNNYLN